MQIEIGNTVLVIDEDLWGTVTKVDGEQISFHCEDGFEYTYLKTQLILLGDDGSASHTVAEKRFTEEKIVPSIIKHEPTTPKPIKFSGKKPVFDLHIDQLAGQRKFHTKHEALEFQLDFVRQVIHDAHRRRVRRMVFVHGMGKGVLREQLRQMLHQQYPNIEYYDGDYSKFGQGATEIIIHGMGKL